MDTRLRELGIELPPVVPPPGSFVPYLISGNYLYLSGKGAPRRNLSPGDIVPKVGREVSLQEANDCARDIGIYFLALIKEALGSLDRVEQIVKVFAMVNAVDDFTEHTEVINGCSDLLVQVFGRRGQHTRSAVGVKSLPKGFAVEIEAMVEIRNA
ncbi:RidA family protein [Trinickia sp. NRRL B-1857]|uniref:RidA family protein n=1 Tax=Trinickia sp. NRRL B-1857 TaxID=3162879 RepID=UPI003D2C1517